MNRVLLSLALLLSSSSWAQALGPSRAETVGFYSPLDIGGSAAQRTRKGSFAARARAGAGGFDWAIGHAGQAALLSLAVIGALAPKAAPVWLRDAMRGSGAPAPTLENLGARPGRPR